MNEENIPKNIFNMKLWKGVVQKEGSEGGRDNVSRIEL
jgi:hypothetical protein